MAHVEKISPVSVNSISTGLMPPCPSIFTSDPSGLHEKIPAALLLPVLLT